MTTWDGLIPETPARLVPANHTGVTLRRGPSKPYLVWLNGSIRRFCAGESEARFVLGEVLKEQRR